MNPDLPNTLPPDLPEPKKTQSSGDSVEKTSETLPDPLQTTDQPPKPATTPATPSSVPSVKPKIPSTLPSSAIPPGYEILGTLGRGGMGVVYKAQQRKANRHVALKMILSADHASETEKQRFQTEAEAIAQLDHPNIVKVFDVGEHDGKPYFALEFCNGGSLAEKIQQNPLAAKKAAEIVAEVAEGMAHAHENGILHRDLKPANILLTSAGQPKITDFGLAKRVSEESGQTRTGAVMGTPSFMAPEQALGDTKYVTEKADIYSLGAILYDCLTGRPPFKGANVMETLDQVRNREPVPPSQLNPSIPTDLETICLKCLQKEPYKRYANANELAVDLNRYLEGKPIRARRVGTIEKSWKWIKRNKLVSGLISGIFLVLAVAVALVTKAYLSESAARRDAVDLAKNEEIAKDEAKASELKAKEEEEKAKSAQAKAELARQLKAEETEKAKKSEETAQKERAIAVRSLTNLNTNSAYRAIENNDPAQAEIFLDKVLPEERSWDWYHLKQMTVGELLPSWTSGKKATSIAVHPQERVMAIGHFDGSASVWDLVDLKKMFEIKQEKDPAKPHLEWKTAKVGFSVDGNYLITLHSRGLAGQDGASLLTRWNLKDQKRAESETLPCYCQNFTQSTEGKIVIPGHTGTMYLFDAKGKLEKEWSYQLPDQKQRIFIDKVAFWGPKGVIGLSNLGHFLVWDTDTKQITINRQAAGELFTSILAHPDLLIVGTSLGPVRMQDPNNQLGGIFAPSIDNQAPSVLLGHKGAVRALASHEGDDISRTERAGETVTLNVGGRPIQVPVGGGGNNVTTRFATAGSDGVIRVWARGRQISLIRTNRAIPIQALEWTRDGNAIISLDDQGDVRFWNPAGNGAGAVELAHTNRTYAMAFEPKNGEMLATGDFSGFVKIWSSDLEANTLVLRAHGAMVTSISISSGGKRMYTTGRDGMLHIWDLLNRKRLKSLRYESAVYADLSPDGQTLAVMPRFSNKILLLDSETAAEKGSIPIELAGDNVKWSPDGQYLSMSVYQSLLVYDVKTQTIKASLKDLSPLVGGHVWYPDSKRIAMSIVPKDGLGTGPVHFGTGALENAGLVLAFDVETNRVIWRNRSMAQKVTITPDSKRLVAVGRSAVRVYDSETGQETLAMPGVGDGVDSLAFAPYRKDVGFRLAFTTSNFFLPHEQNSYLPSRLHFWNGPPQTTQKMVRGYLNTTEHIFASKEKDIALVTSLRDFGLWNPKTGELIHSGNVEQRQRLLVSLRPDGKEYFLVQQEKQGSTTILFFSTEHPTVQTREIKIPASVVIANYSPDGQKLLLFNQIPADQKQLAIPEMKVGIWDAQTGEFLTSLTEKMGKPQPAPTSLCWSPDGERILLEGPQYLELWSSKGKKIWSQQDAFSAIFHPNNQHILAIIREKLSPKEIQFGAQPKQEIRFLDRETGQVMEQSILLQKNFGVTTARLEISPDGKSLAFVGATFGTEEFAKQVFVMDLKQKKIIQEFREPSLAGNFGAQWIEEQRSTLLDITTLAFRNNRELMVGYNNGAFRSYTIQTRTNFDGDRDYRTSASYAPYLYATLMEDYLTILPKLFLKRHSEHLTQLRMLEYRAKTLNELVPESQLLATHYAEILRDLMKALPVEEKDQFAACQEKLKALEKNFPIELEMIPQEQLRIADARAQIERNTDPKLSAELYQFCIEVLGKLIQEYPKDQNYQNRLLEIRRSRAIILSELGQHADALKQFDEVLAMVPPQNQLQLKASRTLLVARSGEHQKATQEIGMLLRGVRDPHASFLHASVYAIALSKVPTDTKLTDEQKATLTKSYTTACVDQLNQAKGLGLFRDNEMLNRFKTHKDFESLRNTDEGKKFLEDLVPKKK